jgi:RNA-directed DNA polymerase
MSEDRGNESMSKESIVPEKATQDLLSRPDWAWLDRNIWTERMLAALGNGVKGGKWYSLIDKIYRPETLEAAWQQVKANKGAAGIDRQSIEIFDAKSERYLDELTEALRKGTYQAQPVRRVEIDKGDGKTRPLGIPTVKDRIVQTAVKNVIEPIFENEFLDMSYGFRPGRGCKDALREVDGLLKQGYTYIVDADMAKYFDSISHELLEAQLEARIGDGRLLEILAGWLRQEVVQELERWTPTGGTPQGSPISPLLANIFLHPLDKLMTERGYRMVRYADDFVILCRSAEEAAKALDEVRAWTTENRLSLHPDKTHVGDCRKEGQGFEFLGYRFEAGKRTVRKKSLKALKDKIRAKTSRTSGKSLKQVIDDLNPMLRGWFGYFKHAHRWTFKAIDGLIRRRLRAMLRKHQKRPGFGRCLNDQLEWPNAYFAKHGLFTLHEAYVKASQS